MSIEQVKNIEELIPLCANKKILSQNVKRLTAPGENYGSMMLSVDLNLQSAIGTEELHVVVKMVPPNEQVQKMFNTSTTFPNEAAFYKRITPALRDFQREHGVKNVVDFYPECYGARLNLQGDDTRLDSNAAIVLENLKSQDYAVLEGTDGFDLDVTRLILKNLAQLHAVPLALKLQKPEVFRSEIRPFLSTWFAVIYDILRQCQLKLIGSIDEMKPFEKRILAAFDKTTVNYEAREPFATVCHNDCWNNNVMVKRGKLKTKLVDYQICNYGSPARDLVFFLFTSVKVQVIEQHYDDLVQFYHKHFIDILEELHCEVQPFTLESLRREIDEEAKTSQFGHILFMLQPIFLARHEVRDITEFHPSDFLAHEPSEDYKKKFAFVVNEFIKRNWI